MNRKFDMDYINESIVLKIINLQDHDCDLSSISGLILFCVRYCFQMQLANAVSNIKYIFLDCYW